MDGYFSIQRKLLISDLWLSEPFTRGQAWVDLLGLANYKDGFIRVRGIKIKVKRGQVGWSQIKLGERWQWSRGKVRRFLKELKTVQQIGQETVQQNNYLTSLINIINYHEYQSDGTANSTTKRTADGQQTDSRRTADGTVRIKNNKDNKDNNVYIHPKNQIGNFCLDFVKYIKKTNPRKAPKSENILKNSYKTINQLITIDGFKFEEIIDIMQWAVKDDFWQDNIFSLAALRSKSQNGLLKFQNILNSMEKENKNNGSKISKQGQQAGKTFIERMQGKR